MKFNSQNRQSVSTIGPITVISSSRITSARVAQVNQTESTLGNSQRETGNYCHVTNERASDAGSKYLQTLPVRINSFRRSLSSCLHETKAVLLQTIGDLTPTSCRQTDGISSISWAMNRSGNRYSVGRGGGLKIEESKPFDRRVEGSNPALAGTYGPWASPSLTVACSASATKFTHTVIAVALSASKRLML